MINKKADENDVKKNYVGDIPPGHTKFSWGSD